jgi:hypothetical protein
MQQRVLVFKMARKIFALKILMAALRGEWTHADVWVVGGDSEVP